MSGAQEKGNKVFNPSIESLIGKGVEVEVWKTIQVQEEDPMTGETVVVYRRINEKRFMEINFTNDIIAQIEKKWGNVGLWQKALQISPFVTVLDTFVILTGNKPASWVGQIIVTEANEEYMFAFQAAYLLAMGAAPEDLGKAIYPVLGIGKMKTEAIREMADGMAEDLTQMVATLGATTSDSGSSSTDPSPTSGNSTSPNTTSLSTPTSSSNGDTKPKEAKRKERKTDPRPVKETSTI